MSAGAIHILSHIERARANSYQVIGPDEQLAAATGEPEKPKAGKDTELLGLTVRELTAAERKETGVTDGGVKVTEVKPGPARTAGIRAGEVIVMIRNHRLAGVEDFRDQVGKLEKGKPVALLIQEKEGSRWLTLTIPDKE